MDWSEGSRKFYKLTDTFYDTEQNLQYFHLAIFQSP